MRTARTALLGALLGLLTAVCTLVPATASTPDTAAPTGPGAPLITVTGESWSSPAYPVICRETSQQVSCTPTSAADVKPQQCFIEVLMNGTDVTVCTTYEGHVPALQAAGGKNLVVKYGCSVGDVVCVTFENAGRGMALAATATMMLVASAMQFDTSTVLWTSAVGEWSFWHWAVLIVLLGAIIWSITAAVVAGSRDELVAALVRAFIAVPAVPLTLWLTGHLLNAIDDLTWHVLTRDGSITLFRTMQEVMWAGGEANYFFAFLIHGILMLTMLLLMLVFSFRNIALAALIAVGPVAWMLFPVKSIGPQWVVRYVSAVVALLLTGPLTNGFVMLIVNGLADIDTIWNPEAWPLIVGLVLAAFAPFAVFGLFNFLGTSAVDAIGSRLGGSAGRTAGNAGRSAARLPSRLTALPAGITASTRSRASTIRPVRTPRTPSTLPTGARTPATRTRAGDRTTPPAPATTKATTSTPTAASPSTTSAPAAAGRTGRAAS